MRAAASDLLHFVAQSKIAPKVIVTLTRSDSKFTNVLLADNEHAFTKKFFSKRLSSHKILESATF